MESKAAFLWIENLLEERFGVHFRAKPSQTGTYLNLENHNGYILFDRPFDPTLVAHKTTYPCQSWNARRSGWDTILEDSIPAPGTPKIQSKLIEQKHRTFTIHYDILGFAYWMLNRIEEIDYKKLDQHQRFTSIHSHAFQNKYHERPIVDEWLHILGQVISRLWPKLPLKIHTYNLRLSHDIDRPFQYAFMGKTQLIKLLAGDLLKRKKLPMAFNRMKLWQKVHSGSLQHDPFNTCRWLMDTSERNNTRSCFYFLCSKHDPQYDADYDIDHLYMRQLLKEINRRGHEIGLHPSYHSANNRRMMANELSKLTRVCEREGITDINFGARMHYLRWEHPATLLALDSIGLSHDSTLMFPDRIGFRCGTCHSYPGFDPISQKLLKIRIIPLLAMEQLIPGFGPTISDEKQITNKLLEFHNKAKKVGGELTLLWHNSNLSGSKTLYSTLIELISK